MIEQVTIVVATTTGGGQEAAQAGLGGTAAAGE